MYAAKVPDDTPGGVHREASRPVEWRYGGVYRPGTAYHGARAGIYTHLAPGMGTLRYMAGYPT